MKNVITAKGIGKMTCNEVCWTPVPCSHGVLMPPKGRSAAMGSFPHFYWCEEEFLWENTRHLWDEHDSTRHYHDPEGWAEHEKNCDECNPRDED